MRVLSGLLFSCVTLAFISHAGAQTPGTEKAPDQMERGVSMSSTSLSAISTDFTKSLQAELKRVGCLNGVVDGVWGESSKAALIAFVRRSKLELPTDAPTEIAVEAVKSRRDRTCPLECGAGHIERNGQCVAIKAAPAPEAKPARPQPTAEYKWPARAASEDDRSKSGGMCWRNDGRATALVPCSETPTGRRAY